MTTTTAQLTEARCAPERTTLPADAWYPLTRNGDDLTVDALTECGLCPVRVDCLAGAHNRREQFGIWGGTMPYERTRERRRQETRQPCDLCPFVGCTGCDSQGDAHVSS